MYTHDTPETAPVRRRIIPQPLRTEPACALITADPAQTAELEARLKRDRPLIIFPSISHFWAEPPRREPWAAVVIARACAWDPRFDSHVRRRRSIALFAVSEEVYSWPETVARVRDLTELSAWLEALNAPEPAPIKQAAKRERRAQAKAALNELSASWLKQSARPVVAPGEPREDVAATPASAVAVKEASLPVSAAPAKQKARVRARPVQLELATVGLQGDPAHTGKRARVDTKGESLAPRKKRGAPVRAPALQKGSAQQERAARANEREQKAPRHRDNTPTNPTAQRDFMRLAAELGLARASELLAELRKRATRLGLSP